MSIKQKKIQQALIDRPNGQFRRPRIASAGIRLINLTIRAVPIVAALKAASGIFSQGR
jgi:hypothetical protein